MQGTSYYRLVNVDINGERDYSEIRSVEFTGKEKMGLPYPNPVKRGQPIYIELPSDVASLQIQLFDFSGRQVQTTHKINHEKRLVIETKSLTQGTYLLAISHKYGLSKYKILIGEYR